MKTMTTGLTWLTLLTGVGAQDAGRRALEVFGVLGLLGNLLFFYLIFLGWALFSVAFIPERTTAQVNTLRTRSTSVFWRGLVILLLGLLIAFLLLSLANAAKDQPAGGIAGLLGILILFLLITLLLIGWGSVSLLLGEAVGRAFGRTDLSPGSAALFGSAPPVLLGWVPVFGWALLIYWTSLAIGCVGSRAGSGE